MWHYACRPPGNEPPILKMKWAGKHQFPGFEVALMTECHFIPLTSLLEAVCRLSCQLQWRIWIEVDTWMYYTMNEAFKRGCSFISTKAAHKTHSPKKFLSLSNICEFVSFFGWQKWHLYIAFSGLKYVGSYGQTCFEPLNFGICVMLRKLIYIINCFLFIGCVWQNIFWARPFWSVQSLFVLKAMV